MTDFDDRAEYVNWVFEPYIAVRPDMPGETIFVRRWQEFIGGAKQKHDVYFIENESYDYPILRILSHSRRPTERDTRVATSVIRFLGTNLGREFLDSAEDIKTAFRTASRFHKDAAYLVTWALKNDPYHPQQTLYHQTYDLRVSLMGDETMSVQDARTMDCVMRWLGTEEGQTFLVGCQTEVRQDLERQMQERRAKLARTSAPNV